MDFDEELNEDLEEDEENSMLPPKPLYNSEERVIASSTSDSQSAAAYWNWLQLKQYDLLLDSKAFPVSGGGNFYVAFPHIEKRRIYTEYGELLDPEEYPKFQFVDSPKLESSRDPDDVSSGTGGGLQNLLGVIQQVTFLKEPSTMPKVYQTLKFKGSFLMSLKQISFEGLCDGKSLKGILEQIQPRKLVLIHGDLPSRQYLAQSLKLANVNKKITLETLILSNQGQPRQNISFLSNLLQVKMDETLFQKQLRWTLKEDYQVASCKAFLSSRSKKEEMPCLEACSTYNANTVAGRGRQSDLLKSFYSMLQSGSARSRSVSEGRPVPATIFIGDARLASLRVFLMNHQIPCHFSEGKLIIPHAQIQFSKNNAEILMESSSGSISSIDYYMIQSLVQSHLLPI